MESQQQKSSILPSQSLVFAWVQALEYILKLVSFNTLPRLITVSGGTCSGKSTFAQELSRRLLAQSYSVAVVELDAYFRNSDDSAIPTGPNGPLFDSSYSFHRNEFAADIADLLRGNSVRIPIYDMRSNHRTEETQRVSPADFIIADGLFAASFLDHPKQSAFHVYMETPAEVCLRRRISRDTTLYSVTESQVTHGFESKILPLWKSHQQSEKTIAHLIVDGTERRNSHGQ